MMPSHATGSVLPGTNMSLHSALLSAVAGYVDAAAFASLIGLFPAHLTGQIVGDALALSSGQPGAHVTRWWILPVFVGSVTVATLVARLLRRSGRRALTGVLGLLTVALATFSASDSLSELLRETWNVQLFLGGACAVAAMGFQNALMRDSLAGSCPTTVMTGNLTHVVIDIVDHLFSKLARPNKRDRRPSSRLFPATIALSAFVGCAVLGGFMTRYFGSLSVLAPTLVTALLTVRAFREDRRLRALSLPEKSMAAARVPSFDLWPDSLAPRAPSPYPPASSATWSLPARSPSPSRPELEHGPLPARAPSPSKPELDRPPLKRVLSGTRLKTNFVKDEC
ncbi:MAG TPA: DUF1275 family protein [Polyangiaceae bacterium]|nr:DUF1275 family protein [Polyangiaceae bacterium]